MSGTNGWPGRITARTMLKQTLGGRLGALRRHPPHGSDGCSRNPVTSQ
jgi:hypothetical protein